ncbi:DNA repair protein XRCC3-like isoform X1 [Centruroides vittatus]|uniref:DNA repair protein XRCC3-like isoform X1 n=1 Tax=Centruroides vittatus TaxID=120091 RepID=UPI003510AF72
MDNSSEIESLDLNPKLTAALLKAKLLTCKNILALSEPELQHKTRLSHQEITTILTSVARLVLKNLSSSTALQIKQGECPNVFKLKKLSTGCGILNSFLRGGILLRHITEISGESASGKTQFCLQLSIQMRLPIELGGLNGGVVYICTEDVFPIKRLHQMIEIMVQKLYKCYDLNYFMDNIYITQIGDLPNLWKCLEKQLPPLIMSRNIKLVILDSVAALFRCEYGIDQTMERSLDLQKLGLILRRLATAHGLAVICVNQVTDIIDETVNESNNCTIPALGLTWSNLIHTRIMLARTNITYKIETDSRNHFTEQKVRNMKVIFSPHLPSSTCHFVVITEGVKDLFEVLYKFA